MQEKPTIKSTKSCNIKNYVCNKKFNQSTYSRKKIKKFKN